MAIHDAVLAKCVVTLNYWTRPQLKTESKGVYRRPQISIRQRLSGVALGGLLFAAAVLSLLPKNAAVAAPPTPGPLGDWLVEKRYAVIRIVDCGGQLWGVVTWQQRANVDMHNPDPAKRNRPTLGMPVLLGMKPGDEPNKWEGEIYNSQNGKTYDSNISLSSPDVLRVEGCVLGFLCGGEDWTRVTAQNTLLPKGVPANFNGPTPADSQKICSGLVGTTGSAHQGRLK